MGTKQPVSGLPTLSWLRAFESAARTSSFAAAAAELNLTSGAVSYQIRSLEGFLGYALFERLPRGVKLTPMGVAYLPAVRKAFEELADATIGLFGGTERRRVTVTAPVSLASLWLAPRLPEFLQSHPHVDVRLSSVIWDNALPDEETDVEIRYGYGHWHGYRSELLLDSRIVIACSPTLLHESKGKRAKFSVPSPLIQIMGYEKSWQSVRQALNLEESSTTLGPTVDTTIAALELAASGAGYVLTHRLFLTSYLATGRLVLASEQTFADEYSHFLVMPLRAQRVKGEVRQFCDWLLEAARAVG